MVRAVLGGSCNQRDDRGVKVALDDSCGPVRGTPGVPTSVPDVEVWPMLEIRLRTRTGFDDDGNPVFTWSAIATERSMLWEERTEVDPDAGVTEVKAKAVLSNDAALEVVPETAVVAAPGSDETWRVTSSAVYPDRVEVQMVRIEHAKTGEQ